MMAAKKVNGNDGSKKKSMGNVLLSIFLSTKEDIHHFIAPSVTYPYLKKKNQNNNSKISQNKQTNFNHSTPTRGQGWGSGGRGGEGDKFLTDLAKRSQHTHC